jgi:hypothetical protein
MFSLTLERPEMVRILKALQERIGLFPLEIKEDGIQIATMDDGRNMAIWVHLPIEMMNHFAFEPVDGGAVERYIVPSEVFTKALGSTSYNIEMGSLMDGSIKINSANGRQIFKIIPERDANPADGEYHRNRFNTIIADGDYVKTRILKQDLLEAVRTTKVASEQIKMTLEDKTLLLSTTDATIEADGIAPLIDEIESPNWSHSYNVKLLNFFLGVTGENSQITLYLLNDNDTLLVDIPLGEHGFCKMAIASIPERGAVEGAD